MMWVINTIREYPRQLDGEINFATERKMTIVFPGFAADQINAFVCGATPARRWAIECEWGEVSLASGPQAAAFRQDQAEAKISIWKEALFAADILLLHASPVFYGLGVPRGDGSAVVLIPGFLGTDAYLTQMHTWLGRIGYRPYFSGIGINAECPNILIQQRLNACIEKALHDTGRKIHLIGHSLGGILARAIAAQRPKEIASVISLAAPFRGTVAHRTVLQAAEAVRRHILKEHGEHVLP